MSPATGLATELRDRLLQDLIATGMMVQLAMNSELAESQAAARALGEVREVLEVAPDRLRSVIDRLGAGA